MTSYVRALTAALALGAVSSIAMPGVGWAQAAGSVAGAVVDSTGRQPIEGVLVVVVGTTRGALTGSDGRYVIRGVSPGLVTVRAQRLGYAPVERRVTVGPAETATVDFALSQVARVLSDVVATGYGTSIRRSVSSSISTVTAEEITNIPIAGIDGALQGKAPGVQVIQNAGNPGNGITVRIRGSASLSASNQPLYVVDGVPMLREDFSQLDIGGQDLSAVTGLSPDEVESISVLKDAAAAAIYGSRGSNGVVMITTKRGRAGKTRFSFNAYTGFQEASKKVDVLNGQEYIEFMSEAMRNDGYSEDDILGTLQLDDLADAVETDWQDEVLRTAPVSDLSLGLSGGSERIQYAVTGTYYNQKGIVIGSGYDRITGRTNFDFNANDKLQLKLSLQLSRELNERNENDNTIDGVVTNAIANQPHLPARLPNGEFTSPDDGLEYSNGLALGTLNTAESRTLRSMGALEAAYNLSERLQLNGRVGMDVLNLRDLRWFSPKIIGTYAAGARGVAQHGNTTANRYLAETYLNWNQSLSDVTNFAITAGGGIEYNGRESDFLQGEGFGSEDTRYVGNAAKITTFASGWSGYNLVSAFTRGNFTLRDRYIFTASVRADGSSRFAQGRRWGYFPAVSAGWVVSEEPWAGWVRSLGDLKIRASLGVTGNQSIGDDRPFLERYARAHYGEEPGLAPATLASPDVRWESTNESDIGFDLALLRGRIGITGDFYVKKTKDLLIARPIPTASGFASIWENVGNIQNKGFEFSLSSRNFEPAATGGFRWTTDFNISTNDNKVTKLFRGEPFTSGIRGVNRIQEGQPLGAFYVIRFTGVDPETGDAMYHDENGDGDVNSDDRIIAGSPWPDYWGGLRNDFSYGGFELSTFLQFSQGGQIYNAMRIFSDDGGYYNDNKFSDVLRRWRNPGDRTDQPRASWDGTSNARQVSSRYIEDGSYIRLQEVTLSYRLPARLLVGSLGEARVFLSGNNLWTDTEFSGYNPDVNSNGSSANTSLATDFYAYPLARTVRFGVSGTW